MLYYFIDSFAKIFHNKSMPSLEERFEVAFSQISEMEALPGGLPEFSDDHPYLLSAFTERFDPTTRNYYNARGIGYVSISLLKPGEEKIVDHHRLFKIGRRLESVQLSVLRGPGLRVTPRPTPPISEASYKAVVLETLDFIEGALVTAKDDSKTVFRI